VSRNPIQHPYRAAVAGAAAVLLLTACGGGSGDTAAVSPDPTGAGTGGSGTTAAAGRSGFCSHAAGIDQRVDAALSDMDDGVASLPEVLRQIGDELRDIAAPAEITADWKAMATGLDGMADAFADFDITDLDSLDALDQAEGNLTEASTDVERYLSDECGL
jgi:hypothetical protein